MHETRYFRVSGHVQGVFFRAATRDTARSLALRGWVRNRDDGSVEGVVSGEDTALAEFRDWLEHGPAPARVERVMFETTSEAAPDSDFQIR